MVSSRKRGRQEMEAADLPEEPSMIQRIRNMWEFANLAQWIFIFGKAVKIDENLDIEDLEIECIMTQSTVLSDIGLALLKFVSSHRGLTPEIFDEYTRRQYVAKAPHRNPFGTDEEPQKFTEFDAFTKIRVLQQLTQWTMINPDRIRERMEEQKDSDQTYWRIEPFGWDSQDRTYIVLDDNRLYRQTEPPPPPPPAPAPKKSSKKAKAALRASKRRKLSEPVVSEEEVIKEPSEAEKTALPTEDDGLGGMKWECLAVTLDELNEFVTSIEKSRDPNEKILRKSIVDDLLPLLEKQEEARKRKAAQKERELLNLEKLATAKRSSRIAGKLEQQRQEEEAREAEHKKLAELAMARKEQEKWVKLEKERESRMMTREQRLKEREARRILHEEELAGLSEDSKKLEAGESRLSERHLKAEIERKKQALEELAEEDGDWVFDCICGAYGQVDDGSHSISCEKCNIWQHTKCVGISEAAANRDDFHFICKTCKRRVEEAEKAKHRPTIKFKVNRPGSSSSPVPPLEANGVKPIASAQATDSPQQSLARSQSAAYSPTPRPEYASPYANSFAPASKAQSLNSSSSTVMPAPIPMDDRRPKSREIADPVKWSPHLNGSVNRSQLQASPHANNGHAFSSPLPHSPTSLPPPPQPRNYSFVNGHSSAGLSGTYTPAPLSTPYKSSPAPLHPNFSPYSTPHNINYGQSVPTTQLAQNRELPHSSQEPVPVQFGHTQNGHHHYNGDYPHHQTSTRLQSPLTSANFPNPSPIHRESVPAKSPSPIKSAGNSLEPMKSPPKQIMSTSIVQTQTQGTAPNIGHAPILPAAVSGVSPVKQATPRPASANGLPNLGATTPSILPPVASLPPAQQRLDLTPPVKITETEKTKVAAQAVAP